jgi:hypothetical protein
MYLFRRQADTFDNYTFLVQPQIEQRALEQQLNGEIHGPANSSQMPGANQRQPYRTNETLQGAAAPYYMNTGNYFPQQQQQDQDQDQ